MKTIVFSCLVLVSTLAFAADPKSPTAGGTPEWTKYTVPGEGHKALNDLVGKFNFTMRWWATPDAKPEESKGTSQSKWILNGRFIQEEVKGKAMGQTFNGIGLTGFDNLKEEYQSVWMDNMSTAMMTSTGKMDPATKAIQQSGTMSDPMTGNKNAPYRSNLKIVSKNEHVYEMYTKDPTGKEFKMMEIQYKRTK